MPIIFVFILHAGHCPLSPGMSGCLPQGQPTQVEFKGDPLNLIGFDWHVLHASVHHWLIACLLNHCWFPLFGRLVTQVWSLQLWESIRKKKIGRLDIITKQREHNRGITNEEKVQNHDGLNAKRMKSDLELKTERLENMMMLQHYLWTFNGRAS